MPGPAPKPNRRRRNVPARGEWQPAPPTEGWQHGEIPTPPENLRPQSVDAWTLWFGAWYAARWTPDMVPGLRLVILAYDHVASGHDVKATDRTALHALMRAYGITPDGQAALRWARPDDPEVPSSQPQQQPAGAGLYAHLKVVND